MSMKNNIFEIKPDKIEIMYIQRFLKEIRKNISYFCTPKNTLLLKVIEYIKKTLEKNGVYNLSLSTEKEVNATYYVYEAFSCLIFEKNIKKTIKIDSFFSEDELQFIDQFI